MKVIATVLGAGQTTTTEIPYTSNGDEVSVMLCVAQILQAAKDDSPWAPRVLGIRVEL